MSSWLCFTFAVRVDDKLEGGERGEPTHSWRYRATSSRRVLRLLLRRDDKSMRFGMIIEPRADRAAETIVITAIVVENES